MQCLASERHHVEKKKQKSETHGNGWTQILCFQADFRCLNTCGLYWNYTNKPSGLWILIKTKPGSYRLFVVDARVRRPMCQYWLWNSTVHCLPLQNSEVWRSVVVTFFKIHLCHVVKCLVYLPRIKNYEYQDFWDRIGFIIQRNVSASCTTTLTLSKH